MPSAQDFYRAAQLDDAITALGGELRSNPTDARRRAFLFELLCFAGEYDRAEKQLDVLAHGNPQAEMGALLYRSALHAERMRQEMFVRSTFPSGRPPRPVSGTLNGQPFASLEDADPRIGARLELFVAGQYTWLPLEHIASVRMERPKQLRDTLWAPVVVRANPMLKEFEFTEVMVPVLAPLTWRHPDGSVRLGQVTEWEELDGGTQAPIGQKLLLVDGEEFPLLELRDLEIAIDAGAAGQSARSSLPH
jgi:type VI secretion system protein ImpE